MVLSKNRTIYPENVLCIIRQKSLTPLQRLQHILKIIFFQLLDLDVTNKTHAITKRNHYQNTHVLLIFTYSNYHVDFEQKVSMSINHCAM